MRKLFILASVTILFLGYGISRADNYKNGNFEAGLEGYWQNIRLKHSGVPESVRNEAANLSITNPYSGRSFGKREIGTFNPTENFKFFNVGLFGKYTIPLKFPIRPYLKMGLGYPISASTNKGEEGEGYTYERVLGSGVDFVRYVYGIKFEYPWYVQPEAGVSYLKHWYSLSFGVGYQRLRLTYYKGVEAFGDPHMEKIGESGHNLFNFKFKLSAFAFNCLGISLEPIYTFGDRVNGWGGGLSAQWMF